MNRSLIILILLLLAGNMPPAALAAPPVAPALQRSSDFRTAACPFDAVPGFTEGQNLECGFLTVPLRHAEPDGPTIELAVAIITQSANLPQTPLVMLQGGPGGSTIDTYTQILLLGQGQRLMDASTIILFDQRGTLYSQPALTCPEQLELVQDTIERRLTDEEGRQLGFEASKACRERLVGEGIDLSAFDSIENAADVDALRRALGYDQINLYGVSYGTLLALHVMRNHPEGLRSVILDAVVPTQTNFLTEVPRSQDRAFGELFRACAADAACNRAYPNLEQTFFALVDRLNEVPARVPVRDAETSLTYDAVLDGDTLAFLVFQALYASDMLPVLPAMIDFAQRGEYGFLSRLYSLVAFDRTFSPGMYQSVICAEDADFTPQDVQTGGIRPFFAEDAQKDAADLLANCAMWNVEQLPASVDAPVASDIPTLVLNGRFDPITPPAFGEAAAQTLSRSTLVTFPNTAHGALTANACAMDITLAFLSDPETPPDTTCAGEQQLQFVVPGTHQMTPFFAHMNNQIERGDVGGYLLLLASLVVLCSLVIIWPVVFLVRLMSRTSKPRPIGSYLGRLVLFLAMLATASYAAWVVASIVALVASMQLDLLFGVPAWQAPFLWLPFVAALLAVAALILTGMAWVRRYGTIWGRIYQSLLTLAALAAASALDQIGAFRSLL